MTSEREPVHRSSPKASEGGWVSDAAIARLRGLEDRPDFAATRYDVLEEIGRGGMGIVFRGRDRELGRDVAIKVTAWSTDGDADRLRREARTLAALEHPGIVPVHDVGQLPDGRVFTVMMLVRGERLDVCAARLPLHDGLRLFDRVCDTMSFAHARGVIHRDLKPENVMLLSVGGGATVLYGKLKEDMAVNTSAPPVKNSADGTLEIDSDDIGYGYNLGILLQPAESTRIGLTYISKVKFKFDDVATVKNVPVGAPILAALGNDPSDTAALAVSRAPSVRLTLSATRSSASVSAIPQAARTRSRMGKNGTPTP
jgi:serine/threonine protein kinase